jgi:hypothetical protein
MTVAAADRPAKTGPPANTAGIPAKGGAARLSRSCHADLAGRPSIPTSSTSKNRPFLSPQKAHSEQCRGEERKASRFRDGIGRHRERMQENVRAARGRVVGDEEEVGLHSFQSGEARFGRASGRVAAFLLSSLCCRRAAPGGVDAPRRRAAGDG